MKRKLFLIAVLVLVGASIGMVHTVYADSPNPAAAQNQIVVDVTIDQAGDLTVGGISLKALGVAPMTGQITQVAKNLDSAHLVVQGDVVTLDAHGSPVLKIQWSPSSRQAVLDLASKYGFAVSPDVLNRAEEWISSSNVDVTARYSNEPSKPLSIKLAKPIIVDVGSQGQVAIEKGPLAYGIDPSVMRTIQMSGAKNALVCWSKGTLSTKVDGKDLPSLTFDPKGVQFLLQTMNLAIGNIQPAFDSQLGADVSLSGGAHSPTFTCGQ